MINFFLEKRNDSDFFCAKKVLKIEHGEILSAPNPTALSTTQQPSFSSINH